MGPVVQYVLIDQWYHIHNYYIYIYTILCSIQLYFKSYVPWLFNRQLRGSHIAVAKQMPKQPIQPIHFQFQLIPADFFSIFHHSHLHFAAELTAPDLKVSKLRFHIRAHSFAGAIKMCHLRSGIGISFDKSELGTASAGRASHWSIDSWTDAAISYQSYQPALLLLHLSCILAASKGQAKGSLLPRPGPTTLPSHLQMGNIPQTKYDHEMFCLKIMAFSRKTRPFLQHYHNMSQTVGLPWSATRLHMEALEALKLSETRSLPGPFIPYSYSTSPSITASECIVEGISPSWHPRPRLSCWKPGKVSTSSRPNILRSEPKPVKRISKCSFQS